MLLCDLFLWIIFIYFCLKALYIYGFMYWKVTHRKCFCFSSIQSHPTQFLSYIPNIYIYTHTHAPTFFFILWKCSIEMVYNFSVSAFILRTSYQEKLQKLILGTATELFHWYCYWLNCSLSNVAKMLWGTVLKCCQKIWQQSLFNFLLTQKKKNL